MSHVLGLNLVRQVHEPLEVLVGDDSFLTRRQSHRADMICCPLSHGVLPLADILFLALIAIAPEGEILVSSSYVVLFPLSCYHLTPLHHTIQDIAFPNAIFSHPFLLPLLLLRFLRRHLFSSLAS